ncbi:MAG: TetR/AcrR family transcriptional regulator [Kiloniellales bacterium]
MPRDGAATRTRIMDAAEALILESGFAAASVDRIVEKAGVTKGGFFYHFDNKAALALALVERYAELEKGHLETNMARAEKLSRDPLQQLLIFIGLFQEMAEQLTEPYPGCLFASFCYEAGLFDETTLETIRTAIRVWRVRVRAKLGEVAARHPPRLAVDLDSLADMLTVTFEGAFVVSRTLEEPQVVAAQLAHCRSYIELLFGDPTAPGRI